MNVDIKSFAHLRLVLGKSPVSVELPAGATVTDLLDLLISQYGDPARQALWTNDGQNLKITPVTGGKRMDLQDPLAEGMTITFMSNLAGG